MKEILKKTESVPKKPLPIKEEMQTLSSIVNALGEEGYKAQFKVESEGLRSLDTNKLFTPEQVKVQSFYRFEGESDPADNSILYAVETEDGEMGTINDAYGIYNDPYIGEFMKKVTEIEKKPHEEVK